MTLSIFLFDGQLHLLILWPGFLQ